MILFNSYRKASLLVHRTPPIQVKREERWHILLSHSLLLDELSSVLFPSFCFDGKNKRYHSSIFFNTHLVQSQKPSSTCFLIPGTKAYFLVSLSLVPSHVNLDIPLPGKRAFLLSFVLFHLVSNFVPQPRLLCLLGFL